MDQTNLIVREGLFQRKIIPLSDIKKVDSKDQRAVNVILVNGSIVKIRMNGIAEGSRNEFKAVLSEFGNEDKNPFN